MPPALGPSRSARRAPERDEQQLFDWERLVPLLVHPAKVAIVEVLEWMEQPLSPTEMVSLFDDDRDLYLSLVAYHVSGLVKVGGLEVVETRKVRGAIEKFYFFPSQ